MTRLARLVLPDIPHHITQRGNRRQTVFFCDDDYEVYKGLLAKGCAKAGVQIWSYCLMPNHVHLIAVPRNGDGLRAAVAEAHRRYAQHINGREGWRGHLWQERFASFPMDDAYLIAAARYVELNPVRARLAAQAWDYRWSSAAAHLREQDDGLVVTAPLRERMGGAAEWRLLLEQHHDGEETEQIRRHVNTGRPLGGEDFVSSLEQLTGRVLAPRKRGRKPVEKAA